MCQQRGDPPRGQDERGRALIPGGRGGKAFADPTPKACSHRKWLGSSRQSRSPTAETVGRAEARPVLLEQQQFCLSLWPRGDPETPSLSDIALSRGAWGWGGLSWGGGAQLSCTRKRWGGKDPGPEGCHLLAQRLQGNEGRRFACSPLRLSERKAPHLGTYSLVLRHPLGRIGT